MKRSIITSQFAAFAVFVGCTASVTYASPPGTAIVGQAKTDAYNSKPLEALLKHEATQSTRFSVDNNFNHPLFLFPSQQPCALQIAATNRLGGIVLAAYQRRDFLAAALPGCASPWVRLLIAPDLAMADTCMIEIDDEGTTFEYRLILVGYAVRCRIGADHRVHYYHRPY